MAVKKVFEVCPIAFKCVGVYIRQIIGNDLELGFQGLHTRGCCV